MAKSKNSYLHYGMKKSTVIATCLINCGSRHGIKEIEQSIQSTFREDFPGLNFQQWNTDIPEPAAQGIIRDFGGSYTIDIRQFILDLM
jgi:hypothetical protein